MLQNAAGRPRKQTIMSMLKHGHELPAIRPINPLQRVSALEQFLLSNLQQRFEFLDASAQDFDFRLHHAVSEQKAALRSPAEMKTQPGKKGKAISAYEMG
jgi:hypothetical protein